jgi:Flp pilus assembly protein TadG
MSIITYSRRPSIWRDQAGIAAVELAAVLPALLLLLIGMVDMSRMIALRLDVEQAAQRTTDLSLAVRPRTGDGTYLRDEAMSVAGVPATGVAVDLFFECNGARQASYTGRCAPGQTPARFVSVTITKPFVPLFNWARLTRLVGSSTIPTQVRVTGDSIVRTA